MESVHFRLNELTSNPAILQSNLRRSPQCTLFFGRASSNQAFSGTKKSESVCHKLLKSTVNIRKEVSIRRYKERFSVKSVTLSPVTTQDDAQDRQLRRVWEEAHRLRDILGRLKVATSVDTRDAILSSDSRVSAVFPSPGMSTKKYVKPAVEMAIKILNQSDLYLLKCLAACGQEHVLDLPVGWEDEDTDFQYAEGMMLSETTEEGIKFQSRSLKDAFSMLASMIEGWETSPGEDKNAEKLPFSNLMNGWDSPGVFPAQIMDIVDWEGRHTEVAYKPASGNNEESFFSQVLNGWESPGVFPSQVMDLFDLDGRMEKANYDERQLIGGRSVGRDGNGRSVFSGRLRPAESLKQLVRMLKQMDKFYDSIGGILGYQLASLDLIVADAEASRGRPDESELRRDMQRFYVPIGADLARDHAFATRAAFWGLEGVPKMGEIYPLGGAGDRLGLVDEATGECLPVAMLQYCGRTLLEGLIRDLQAREYLHFRVFGEQHTTPVAIMTSAAKQNNQRVRALCQSNGWFGRGSENFFLFEQPLVPSVAAKDGKWLASDPLTPVLKPGGHGVIWKLAADKGVFEWFKQKGRSAALVRQISNPLAATDVTLLALSGVGLHQKKKFGFASCDRNVGTAEGVNVVRETRYLDEEGHEKWDYSITCIEYTEFKKLGISDMPVSPGSLQAQFPANTNVLFADLDSVATAVRRSSQAALPGLIMNLKKSVSFTDHSGRSHSVKAGRLECTMQNVADSLKDSFEDPLPLERHGDLSTFLLYNDRRKVTSSAKRRRNPEEFSLHQTPDGSFLDLNRNSCELFSSCGVAMSKMEGNQCYIESGPPFVVVFHPALGPLWDIIRQKVRGGSIADGSEVKLEVAELSWQDVHVDGSLQIEAENVIGETEILEDGSTFLRYGRRCGRCWLSNVTVSNAGVDWESPENVFWQHRLVRRESLRIVLRGNAEFEAIDVEITGSHLFEVPSGYRMTVTSSSEGGFVVRTERLGDQAPSWEWKYFPQETGYIGLSLLKRQ